MELLSPAGGPEQLRLAIHFGADAVYLAGRSWGMRARSRNFTNDELADAVTYAHARGVAIHVTLNTVMTDADIDALPCYLAFLDEVGVDAVIAEDLGAMALVRQHAPHVALHVSTQASVVNALAAEQYAHLGARRIVLAREMTLDQIAELRRRLGAEIELEVFAHGSMCMAYSGRCLMSAELMGPSRSANAGACAQPCRWSWSLVEERAGERVPLEQDGRGSYLLSSNDLCMLEHLDDLRAAGVASLKIEGRAKGSYYVAAVTNAYRHVLDGGRAGDWLCEVEATSHRPFSTGFFYGDPQQNPGHEDYVRERTMVAVVEGCAARPDGLFDVEVTCRNRADEGALLDVLSPRKPVRQFRLGLRGAMARNGERYVVQVPFSLDSLDLLCAPMAQ